MREKRGGGIEREKERENVVMLCQGNRGTGQLANSRVSKTTWKMAATASGHSGEKLIKFYYANPWKAEISKRTGIVTRQHSELNKGKS